MIFLKKKESPLPPPKKKRPLYLQKRKVIPLPLPPPPKKKKKTGLRCYWTAPAIPKDSPRPSPSLGALRWARGSFFRFGFKKSRSFPDFRIFCFFLGGEPFVFFVLFCSFRIFTYIYCICWLLFFFWGGGKEPRNEFLFPSPP